MKKICLFVMLLCLLSVGTAGAVLLTLETASTVVDPLTDFDVDLVVSGLSNGGPDSVGAFDVDILYDPVTMAFVNYQLGDLLGVPPLEAIDISSGDLGGTVDLAELSLLFDFELDALQSDSFTLATLTFQLSGLDSSVISIDVSDPFLAVSDSFGGPLPVVVGDSLTIAPVPEPTTLMLFGLGLVGLAASFRKKYMKI